MIVYHKSSDAEAGEKEPGSRGACGVSSGIRPETVKELVEGLVCLGVRQYNEREGYRADRSLADQ